MSGSRVLGWLAAGSLALSSVLIGAPARAADPPTAPVRVPGHPMPSPLRLIGASESGVAVVQGDDDSLPGGWPQAKVLTGAEGQELTERPVVQPQSSNGARLLLDVRGDQLGWAAQTAAHYEQSIWQVHRTNILSGADRIDASTTRPAVFEGPSWLTRDSVLALPPSGAQLPLYRHTAGSGTGGPDGEMDVVRLLDHAEGVVDFASDGTNVVVAVADPPLPGPFEADTAPSRTFRVQRLSSASEPVTTLAETTDVVASVAIGSGITAWDSQAPGQSRRIHSLREGAEATSYTEDSEASINLVAGTDGVGYLIGSWLRIVDGTSARTVALPEGSAGLAAVGDRFLTAAGGSSQVAGVFSIGPDDQLTRTATVPSASALHPVQDLDLAGSSLYYTDSAPNGSAVRSIWKTPVADAASPAQRFRTNGLPALTTSPSWYQTHFSAGRGLVLAHSDEFTRWHLMDRGKVTATIESNQSYGLNVRPTISGPYALIDRTVFRPDGTEIYQVPESYWFGLGKRALFGSTLVYSTFPVDSSDSEVWVDDVEDPEPRLLDTSSDCYPGAPVAVWGETVAWTSSCSDGTITVQNLRTGAQRTINGGAGSPAGATGELQLGEGALFWTLWPDGGSSTRQGFVLDLTDSDSEPVALRGDWTEAAFDDHYLAHRTSPAGPIEVQRLPFEGNYRPRLIGQVAAASFATGAVWRPRFDVTKPLTDVKVTIVSSAGRTVRTLTGTAPDGSIRDIAWDGKDADGQVRPAGLYRWTLTASAADGEGSLVGQNGGTTVIGSVRIR